MISSICRYTCIFVFAILAAFGQNVPISSIRIYTVPDGARFYVDGTLYYASQTFLWAQGSKHIVQFPVQMIDGQPTNYQVSMDGGTRYTFGGWQDSNGILAPANSLNQTITADPSVTSLKAVVSTTYKVSLRFSTSPTAAPGCDGAPSNAPQDSTRAGIVFLQGGGQPCFGSNADMFLAAGTYNVNAFPYPGWVFTGWYVNGQAYPAYLSQISVLGPVTVAPVFQQGRRVQFVSDPFGMQLLIDRTPTPTSAYNILDGIILQPGPNSAPCQAGNSLPPGAPVGIPMLCLGEFDFLPGSTHTIAAVTPQLDRSGKWWVFDSFSNGMKQNSIYTTGTNTSSKDVVTAKFVPGVQTAFLTSPTGLKLQVDGTTAWQSYNFIWADGSSHTVTAPPTQTDNSGRKWTFQGWSNGGTATQTFKADASAPNQRLIANYTLLGQVKVTTNPPGVKIQIDGADCVAPCTVDRESGAKIAISVPQTIPMDANSRMDFQGWSDGGANVRTFTFSGDSVALWANYGTSYRLTTGSDPAGGVDLTFDPPSSDSFFSGDSVVNISAKAKPGFKFRRWGGDAAGVYPATQVSMNGPRTVMAMLDRTPYLAPAGIRNAAGTTPDNIVAPGSIIAILGESLAPAYQAGPVNPLAQAIGDTVVTVNDRLLPLLFVSPNQINAQVLSDLPDGDYVLQVQTTGSATVTGTFTISRNAPGLFTRTADGDSRPFALAFHEDGTPLTPDSPARRGETVSILGTGFGPFDGKLIDGFITPDPSNYRLLDPLLIAAGDQPIQPVWTGAAPGTVGTAVTKFKIDDGMPAASNLELTVSVNGKSSNKVLLPLQ